MEEFKNIIIVGDFNAPLMSMDRFSRQEINMETLALNDTLDQINLTDIYRTFHLKATEHTFFSGAHGTFSKIDHMLGHKTSLNKFEDWNHITHLFQHQWHKTKINYMKKIGKFTNMWRLNNMLLNNQGVKEEIKRENKNTLRQLKMEM